MINKTLFVTTLITVLLTSCNNAIQPRSLYGNWKYVKVDKPKSDDPADTTNTADLIANSPYISFTNKNRLEIHWGGKILSHGTFTITGDNINYTEQLENGATRTFPFWVSKLDDKQIVFETLDKDGSRVTAVKNP